MVSYDGRTAEVGDSKGMRDLAVLLARPGEEVHVVDLAGVGASRRGDPVLDERPKAAYQRRLRELEEDLDEAQGHNDLVRASRAEAERDALVAELSAALGLTGRERRLGDDVERTRKAVSARIRDARPSARCSPPTRSGQQPSCCQCAVLGAHRHGELVARQAAPSACLFGDTHEEARDIGPLKQSAYRGQGPPGGVVPNGPQRNGGPAPQPSSGPLLLTVGCARPLTWRCAWLLSFRPRHDRVLSLEGGAGGVRWRDRAAAKSPAGSRC